ncbi:MAG: diguanylate phosphodiesterase [Enterovirga sp.]|nr:diguanylate phosphodiesterase [Enterovirga sp.]
MRSSTVGTGGTLFGALAGFAAVGAAGFSLPYIVPLGDSAVGLALGVGGAALLGAVMARTGASRRRDLDERLTEELDAMSRRLLRLEAEIAALDGSGSRASSTLHDVAGDVHSLSEVVKSLAEALNVQDRELLALRRAADRGLSFRASVPGAADVTRTGGSQIVPSFLPSRDVTQPQPAASGRDVAEPEPPSPDAVLAASAEGQLDLHVHRVVSLPQRHTRIFQLYPLLRVRGGALVPDQIGAALEQIERTTEHDALVLSQALAFGRAIGAAGSDAAVSCPVSLHSLRDGAFLDQAEAMLGTLGAAAAQLVLEAPQAAFDEAGQSEQSLRALRERGVTFAIRAGTALPVDWARLAAQGVVYVRLTAERLLAASAADAEVPAALARSGILAIADGVADDRLVPELIEIDVPLAQGFALSLPMPAAAVLEEARSTTSAFAGAVADGPARVHDDVSLGTRRPLRSFLRRAG